MIKISKQLIIVVACYEHGASNDPEALKLAFPKALHSLMHIVHIRQYGGNDLPQPGSQ